MEELQPEMSPELSAKRAMMAHGYLLFFASIALCVVIPTLIMLPALQGGAQTPGIFYGVMACRVLGLISCAFACAKYAEAKGYSPWLGLTGLFCIGFLIVLALHDRNVLEGEEDSAF